MGEKVKIANEHEKNLYDSIHDVLEEETVLSKETQNKLDDYINEIEKLSQEIQTSETYRKYKKLKQEADPFLESLQFYFIVSEEEYKLMREIIFNETEYDREHLFIALTLEEEFFVSLEGQKENGSAAGLKNSELFKDGSNERIKIDIHNLTRISYILAKHTVKGINKKAYNFANLLYKIGQISRVFEFYNARLKRVTETYQNSAQGLGSESDQNGQNKEEKVLKNTTEQPKS